MEIKIKFKKNENYKKVNQKKIETKIKNIQNKKSKL